jgi:hypothetical protein
MRPFRRRRRVVETNRGHARRRRPERARRVRRPRGRDCRRLVRVRFDNAEGAIRCGLVIVRALDAIRLPIRVGIHSGEVVLSDDQLRGRVVHAAARYPNVRDVA